MKRTTRSSFRLGTGTFGTDAPDEGENPSSLPPSFWDSGGLLRATDFRSFAAGRRSKDRANCGANVLAGKGVREQPFEFRLLPRRWRSRGTWGSLPSEPPTPPGQVPRGRREERPSGAGDGKAPGSRAGGRARARAPFSAVWRGRTHARLGGWARFATVGGAAAAAVAAPAAALRQAPAGLA